MRYRLCTTLIAAGLAFAPPASLAQLASRQLFGAAGDLVGTTAGVAGDSSFQDLMRVQARPIFVMDSAVEEVRRRRQIASEQFCRRASASWEQSAATRYASELAGLFARSGDESAAERAFRKYGSDAQLAAYLAARGHILEAKAYYQRDIAWLGLQSTNYDRFALYGELDGFVAILRTRNASNEAEPLLKAALSLEETAKDSSLALLVGRHNALGDFYAGEGRQFNALAAYQRALHLYEAANAGNDALLSEIDKVIGVEVATSRFQEADALYRRSLELEVPDYETLKLDELHETSQSVNPAGPNKPSIVSRLEKYAIYFEARVVTRKQLPPCTAAPCCSGPMIWSRIWRTLPQSLIWTTRKTGTT